MHGITWDREWPAPCTCGSANDPAIALETLIYRDRDGYLWVRARWGRVSDGKQLEAHEGGVYTDVDAFVRATVTPLMHRTMHK